MVTWYWSVDNLIWQVAVDHNMISFIHKVHGKPTYYLKDGRHVARLHRRRRRRRAHPRAIPLAMITMKKINSWVSFTFYGYRAPLGSLRPPELRYYWKGHVWLPCIRAQTGMQPDKRRKNAKVTNRCLKQFLFSIKSLPCYLVRMQLYKNSFSHNMPTALKIIYIIATK